MLVLQVTGKRRVTKKRFGALVPSAVEFNNGQCKRPSHGEGKDFQLDKALGYILKLQNAGFVGSL